MCLKTLFPETVYDVFFQNNLSQHSKVLQQQEVIKVGRQPVNICCNYSLVMRRVGLAVWVTALCSLPWAANRSLWWYTGAQAHDRHLGPPQGCAAEGVLCFSQEFHFPTQDEDSVLSFFPIASPEAIRTHFIWSSNSTPIFFFNQE